MDLLQQIDEVCKLLLEHPPNWTMIDKCTSKIDNLRRKNWGPVHPDSQELVLRTNPLKVAVMEAKSTKMLEILIKNGLDVDALWQGVCRTYGGQRVELRGLTSLTCALARNDLKMVTKLVQLGADVNMQIPCYSYFNGEWHEYFTSPLLTAVELSKAETVELILRYGAKITMTCKTTAGGDLDAQTLAEFRQDYSILNVIESHGKQMLDLKELCRFVIRNNLTKKSSSDYEKLNIPVSLTQYLKFE